MNLSDKEMYVECGADLMDNYLFEPDEIVFKKEDVKELINTIKNHIISKQGFTDYVMNGNKTIEFIDKLAGGELDGNKI